MVAPGAPCLIEPGEEVELRREVRVARREHLERARSLCDLDAGLDFIEATSIAEAATSTADDDVETRTRVFDPEFLDQWERLSTHANRLFESAVQHVEAACMRQRNRPRARQRPVGDGVESLSDVAIRRGSVAGEPREACGYRCGFRLSFDVSRRAKSLERLR